jgi:TonB family protein
MFANATSMRAVLIAASGVLCLTDGTTMAQTRGAITGSVRDSAGYGITGVEVSAIGAVERARTDEFGRFRLHDAPLGSVRLQIRRIGFRIDTIEIRVAPNEVAEVDFQMAAVETRLEPVVVSSRRKRQGGRLAGFYERMQSGLSGYYLTRDDLERGNPRQLTNVLQRVPGVEIMRGRIRMRGRQCAPLVWLDGVAMPAGEVDINTFAPASLEGIELYLTATGAPLRYSHTVDRGRCGTILLWSRGADTDLRRRPTRVSAAEIERRHLARQAWTAEEVDVSAELQEDVAARVVYPPELYAGQVTGAVLLEVVVDSTGKPRDDTYGVIFSSHPLFARAAQDALKTAQFRPAMRNGRPVAQIVHLPFRFDPRAGHDPEKER